MGTMRKVGARAWSVPAGVANEPTRPAARARVLVVDDEAEVAAGLQAALLACEIAVDTRTSRKAALEQAAREPYSVFLLDYAMPEQNGIALAEELAQLRPTASFILVTGRGDVNLPDAEKRRSSFMGIVQKPCDPVELVATIDRAQVAYEERERRLSKVPGAPPLDWSSILLVEDSDLEAEFVQMLLQGSELAGLTVTHANRLAEAEQRLREQAPSCILTDLSLPDARGLDAIVRLRSLCPSTPLVVLSGALDDVISMQAVEEGANEVLQKAELNATTLLRALRHAAHRGVADNALRELADRDALTGLASRARFEAALAKAVTQAERSGAPLSLLYIDLDQFKKINDTLGHAAGDAVLREAAHRITAALRKHDLVGRLGGDEMAALLEETGRKQATDLAERLSRALSAPLPEYPEARMGASIGLASYPEDGLTAAALLEHADRCMYRVKKRGNSEGAFDDPGTSEIPVAQTLAQHADSLDVNGIDVGIVSLHGVDGDGKRILEVEPRLARNPSFPLEPETLRRLAEDGPALRRVYSRLTRRAADLAQAGSTRVLVTVTEDFCKLEQAFELFHALGPAAQGRLCIGLPQAWLERDPDHANLAMQELANRRVNTVVADFGAKGADVALLSRLVGLSGVCVDGHLLRELSVEPRRVAAFLAAVASVGAALHLQVFVRERDRALCASLKA